MAIVDIVIEQLYFLEQVTLAMVDPGDGQTDFAFGFQQQTHRIISEFQ